MLLCQKLHENYIINVCTLAVNCYFFSKHNLLRGNRKRPRLFSLWTINRLFLTSVQSFSQKYNKTGCTAFLKYLLIEKNAKIVLEVQDNVLKLLKR